MNQARLEELLEEATVDCYGEEEVFWGIVTTLQDNLNFPLRAQAMGEPVEVIQLDEERSSTQRGIVARVRKDGKEYSTSLSELTFMQLDPDSAEWLAMYRYWQGE
ncbi:MAG: calcium-binding protein [Caldilineaceae bacterium]